MMTDIIENTLKNINGIIQRADRLVVIISKPVDPDCVGTAFALEWLLQNLNKNVDIVSFSPVPQSMSGFPCIKKVQISEPDSFNFNCYNVMVLVDGSSWEQFFGDNWKIILNSMDVNKVINLDHHVPDEIHAAIPERCLNIKTSCTAQLLYDYFIKPSNINLPPYIADALYIALIYDSRMFKNEIYQGQYKFAEDLLSLGVNHLKAVDTNYDLKEIDFLVWAVEHTEFMPDLHLTILYIDSLLNVELQEELGKNWLEYDSLYKETIERQVKGYNYGIMLIDNMDGHIRLNWRTRNFGNNISIAEVARKAGFNAGGHRNAGGGSFRGTFEDAKARLIQEIYKELKKG